MQQAKDNARILGLSFAYATNGLGIEAGHIVLHSHKANFIEDDLPKNEQEAEADAFVAEIVIPAIAWQRFMDAHPRISKDGITTFAHELGIAPGIIVGRLQHEQKSPMLIVMASNSRSHCLQIR